MFNISANIHYFSESTSFYLIFLFFPLQKGVGEVLERLFFCVVDTHDLEGLGGQVEFVLDGVLDVALDAELLVDLEDIVDFCVRVVGGGGGEESA